MSSEEGSRENRIHTRQKKTTHYSIEQMEWDEAYQALKERIMCDEGFHELVRCYGGNPNGYIPSQRAKRLAIRICERLGKEPNIYLGNVFGAAADYIREKS